MKGFLMCNNATQYSISAEFKPSVSHLIFPRQSAPLFPDNRTNETKTKKVPVHKIGQKFGTESKMN